jgi:hypothetical protein
MTNIYCYVDDEEITHWILWDPDSRDNGGRMLLEDAMKTGFPIRAFVEDQENKTLEDLSNFLFCKYHDDDKDYTKFLLRGFEGDMGAFVDFLEDNLSDKDLKDLKTRLDRKLTAQKVTVETI